MKTTRFSPLFLRLMPLALLVVAGGCDGGSNDDPEEVALGTVTARINGERFDSRAGIATLATSSGQPMFTFVSGGIRYGLAFTLYPFAGPDTYSFDTTNAGGRIRFGIVTGAGPTYSTLRAGGSGSAQITRVAESSVEGTFTYTAMTPDGVAVKVTEGRFNVPLQRE